METAPKAPLGLILEARKNSHGEFRDNSFVSQDLKTVLRSTTNWKKIKSWQKECLDMLAHKIGRILEGDHMFQDHWDDIEGYAKLAADRVREDNTNGH